MGSDKVVTEDLVNSADPVSEQAAAAAEELEELANTYELCTKKLGR